MLVMMNFRDVFFMLNVLALSLLNGQSLQTVTLNPGLNIVTLHVEKEGEGPQTIADTFGLNNEIGLNEGRDQIPRDWVSFWNNETQTKTTYTPDFFPWRTWRLAGQDEDHSHEPIPQSMVFWISRADTAPTSTILFEGKPRTEPVTLSLSKGLNLLPGFRRFLLDDLLENGQFAHAQGRPSSDIIWKQTGPTMNGPVPPVEGYTGYFIDPEGRLAITRDGVNAEPGDVDPSMVSLEQGFWLEMKEEPLVPTITLTPPFVPPPPPIKIVSVPESVSFGVPFPIECEIADGVEAIDIAATLLTESGVIPVRITEISDDRRTAVGMAVDMAWDRRFRRDLFIPFRLVMRLGHGRMALPKSRDANITPSQAGWFWHEDEHQDLAASPTFIRVGEPLKHGVDWQSQQYYCYENIGSELWPPTTTLDFYADVPLPGGGYAFHLENVTIQRETRPTMNSVQALQSANERVEKVYNFLTESLTTILPETQGELGIALQPAHLSKANSGWMNPPRIIRMPELPPSSDYDTLLRQQDPSRFPSDPPTRDDLDDSILYFASVASGYPELRAEATPSPLPGNFSTTQATTRTPLRVSLGRARNRFEFHFIRDAQKAPASNFEIQASIDLKNWRTDRVLIPERSLSQVQQISDELLLETIPTFAFPTSFPGFYYRLALTQN